MDVPKRGMTFDQAARYRLAARLLAAAAGPEPRVLDVGSREGFLREFLPGTRVCRLDRDGFGGPDFVRGDGCRLPFRDRAFTAAIALDVLEHLPAERRGPFLTELARVADRAVLLSAPFAGGEVEKAEALANEFYLLLNGEENPFLVEHLSLGLPDLEETRRAFPGSEWRSAVYPTVPLDAWLAMMGINFFLATLPNSWGMISALNELCRDRFPPPGGETASYGRLICWVRGGEGELPAAPQGASGFDAALFREALAVIERGIEAYSRDYRELEERHRADLEKFQALLESAQAELASAREEHRREVKMLTGLLDERAADIRVLKEALAARPLEKLRRRLGLDRPRQE